MRTIALIFAAACAASGLVHAASPSPAARAEIDYLFAYLGKSDCEFFRNGDWHGAGDARSHLQRKYDALVKDGQIATTEDFIAKGGTESSMSGKPYQVRCGGRPAVPSAQWLTNELQRYRQESKK